uniref:rRNA methyltransferase 1, mitochondrial n=1 Tax=Blastobotrys adeninivorans TaxID=409370 RepID=A0A060T5L7_BLAAD
MRSGLRLAFRSMGILRAEPRPPPIKMTGKTFDEMLPKSRNRRKAWEGQDKDQFFREKYAHVHARTLEKDREMRKKRKLEAKGKKDVEGGNGEKQPRKVNFSRLRDPHKEYLYGTNPVIHALQGEKRSGYTKLYSSDFEATINPAALKLAREKGVRIEFNTSRHELNLLTNNGVHNGLVLETQPLSIPDISGAAYDEGTGIINLDLHGPLSSKQQLKPNGIYGKKYPFGLFVDQVTDSHNLGAIIRSAYYLGVDFMAFSEKNCAKLSPVVAKSSAGALDLLPMYNVMKPLQFASNCIDKGNWNMVAAVPNPDRMPGSKMVQLSGVKELLANGPTMLVLGSEGSGLRKSLLDRCTHGTTLGGGQGLHIDSLNVSVAAALLISHFHAPDALDRSN